MVHLAEPAVFAGCIGCIGVPPHRPPSLGSAWSSARAVGNSVVRHRVSRRLRAQLAQRLERLPERSITVVRALPGIAADSSAQLGSDLDAALSRLSAAGDRA